MKKNRSKLLLTTHVEKFSSCYLEMQNLNKDHYNEISVHKRYNIRLEPDYDRYFKLENEGSLLYVTLRNQGKIVGYYIGFILTDLHYKSCLSAFQDILFISLKARGQNAFPLLVNAVECEAKRRGCKRITFGVKENHKLHMQKQLIDLEYKPFEIHYCKWF